MSFFSALYIAGVLCAFFAFMGLVAWGQYTTRQSSRAAEAGNKPATPSGIATLQRAAKPAKASAEARQQEEPQPLSAVL